MRAFLIGASPGADPVHSKKVLVDLKFNPAQDLLVAVDGGVHATLELGYKPQLAVGDWDSLRESGGKGVERLLKSLHHLTLPRDKDASDLFYALRAVVQAGATELICLGVTGGRPDHHLAALLDLSAFSAGKYGSLAAVSAYGPEADYFFLSKKILSWHSMFKKARLLSVFSLQGVTRGVSLSGVRFALNNAALEAGSQGLSNQTLAGKPTQVRIKSGAVVVVVPR
ncbi:thiamine diphosphokinase [Bdellovibrionota bacterium FG-1]